MAQFSTQQLIDLGYKIQHDGVSWSRPGISQNTRIKQFNGSRINNSAYPSTQNTRQAPKLEPTPIHAPLGARQAQSPTGQGFLVRVTSIRKRLLDEDNLCEKYHVDLCRYAGIIPGDEAGTAKIETCQRKAQKGEAEHTLIEVLTTTA